MHGRNHIALQSITTRTILVHQPCTEKNYYWHQKGFFEAPFLIPDLGLLDKGPGFSPQISHQSGQIGFERFVSTLYFGQMELQTDTVALRQGWTLLSPTYFVPIIGAEPAFLLVGTIGWSLGYCTTLMGKKMKATQTGKNQEKYVSRQKKLSKPTGNITWIALLNLLWIIVFIDREYLGNWV